MVHSATAAADAEQPRRSVIGRAPLRQPAASHADRARSVGGGFICSRRLPPRGSNRLRCCRAGNCSTRRFPSVCCFQRTRRWESTKAAPLPCKSPPLSGTAQQAQKCISSPLRGNGRGAGVSAGQPSCEGLGRVPSPSPVDGVHVPDQKSLRTHLYGGRQQRSNKSVAICRTRCAFARHGAGAHGGRGCAWVGAKPMQDAGHAPRTATLFWAAASASLAEANRLPVLL